MLSNVIPIREVAEEVGFYDQAYFHRIFKKNYRMFADHIFGRKNG